MDALIVGAGTVRADDPLLTARPAGPRTATRIVLTRSGKLPDDCQLTETLRQGPVMIAGPHQDEMRLLGLDYVKVDTVSDLLAELGRRRFTNVLVEGGAGVLGAFHDGRLIDEFHVFIAPKIAGGESALGPVGGQGVERIPDSVTLADWTGEPSGPDWYLHGRTK
jgi:diaminohydroxyphosphoribosylaminopyrimidine deaminase/5-amino-6-(5-phosphoribosylamino)uracil reductase